MKNKILLTLALGLAGASQLMAGTVDIYLTGSTAFRANAYAASVNLFSPAPTIYYGDASHGGANSGFNSSTASWVMTGTPVSTLTNLQGNTLVIHGLFTGSIQGVENVEDQVQLVFPAPSGTAGGNCNAYVTNTPTIAFSDASASVTPYAASGNYAEEDVAVLPFGFFKAVSSGAGATALANLSNVSWEQAAYGIPAGRIPLSAWTFNQADTNTYIYLLQRTKDSGTRRSETAQMYFQFNDTVGCYIYDYTNNFWYLPTVTANTSFGASPNGIVGAAGLNNVNLNWGYGYVGGGDIKNSLNSVGSSNTAIGYVSFSDGKAIGSSSVAYQNLLSFNGVWPTAAGAGIRGQGNSATNDFSPITSGYYPCWSKLVIVYPINPALQSGQTISQTQLGSQVQPGSFLGVFNAQTLVQPGLNGVPLVGSIEREIEISKPNGATAIRLSDMKSKRATVGGTISPF